MWWLVHCLVVLGCAIYFYLKNVYKHWEQLGVPTPNFRYLLGNLGPSLTLKKSVGLIYTDIYKDFEGYNYVGYYKFLQPGIIVRSPELVKDILIKHFNNFHDNDFYVDEKTDLIFGKNPFVLTGEKWKSVRNQLTPFFSTTKVKSMWPLIHENSCKLVKYLSETPEATSSEGLEAKLLSSKYTCENVASCAFGLNGQSFVDPNAEFITQGAKLVDISMSNALKITTVSIFPALANILKVKFFSDECVAFCKRIIKQTMEFRQENNIVRKDFLDMMHELKIKIGNEKEFNLDDIIAHAGGFLVDGLETSAIGISYALYQLGKNPHVQQKLKKEIDDVLKNYNNELTYEALQDMKYLDCVFKESLRLHVPLLAMARVCTQSFELPPLKEGSTGPKVVVKPGTPMIIPVYAIHMDEHIYSDPKSFIPERFSDENVGNIPKCTYLPFGEGPRMCLGTKFGVLQSKVALAQVVKDFEIIPNKKTLEPLEIDPRHFLMATLGGLWLNFKKRNV